MAKVYLKKVKVDDGLFPCKFNKRDCYFFDKDCLEKYPCSDGSVYIQVAKPKGKEN